MVVSCSMINERLSFVCVLKKHEKDMILIQVYVDDIIFGSNNNSL